jgi:ribosomal protein S24E
MPKIKSHKTVEQIAKKHRLDVSFIQKQLDMGEPIEHEHTQDHELARNIALQHLDEIPDYYTRLKKMEADAKKHHKKFKDIKEEGLRDWFGKSKSKDGKSGWVNVVTGGTCASDEPGEGVPKCVSSSKRASMTKAERLSASRRKKAADSDQQQKSNAAKPTYVSTDSPRNKMKEEMDVQEAKDKPSKGSGKKDACYHKVKSRYSVWPSAYASGALVKCRNVGADNWGTKSEETMHEEERYCPLCDKRETRSECSYGEKAWDKVSVKDEEYSMARSELKTIEDAVKRIKSKVGKGEGDLEAWVQSKITKAADYIDTAADYIASGEMEESFGYEIDPEKHKKTKMSSAAKKIANMTTAQQAQLPQKAKKVVGVTLPKFEETLVDKITREILDEKCWPGYKRKKGTKEFDKGSCVKAEDVTIEDADGNTFAEVVDIIKPEPIRGFKSQVSEATRLQAQTGNVIAVTLSWRGKYYSMKMFFPQVKTPSRKEINDELQKVYPGSVAIYHSVSEIQPGQPLVQMCGPRGGSSAKPGPNKNYVKTMGEEVELEEEGPSLSVGRGEKLPVSRGGGLTKKGREKYNRATGSNLQAPVTGDVEPGSRAAKRRKAFCSRSRSWKGERGLAARRRWKC